jgi:tripartite-type tricarboxylate transporter receptor subunit TctC
MLIRRWDIGPNLAISPERRIENSMQELKPFAAATVLAVALVTASVLPASAADAVAGFYTGKTVQVLVGFGPGGGYDLYARTLARYMGRHIPGHPTMVPQNMPGAGSLKVMNYIYSVARKDGTAIGTFARGLVVEPLLGHAQGTQFDATKFNWIGSVSNEVGVCAFWYTSAIKTWEDMKTKPHTVGGSAAGADSDVFPIVLRNVYHLQTKLVTGFSGGGADINLGMERREVDGRCGWSWSSLQSQSRPLLEGKKINIVLQLALQKHEDLPNVPLVMDLPASPQDKAAMKLIVSRQSIARPFAAPPGVPPERVTALRDAFDATMKDPDFLAETKRLALEVRPVNGMDVEALIKEVYASPPDVVKRAKEIER